MTPPAQSVCSMPQLTACQSKWIHGSCITLSVVLSTIGLLAQFDVLKSIGMTSPSWLPYVLYGGAGVFAAIEGIYLASTSTCCQKNEGNESNHSAVIYTAKEEKIPFNKQEEPLSYGSYNKSLPLTKREFDSLNMELQNADKDWVINQTEKYLAQFSNDPIEWQRQAKFQARFYAGCMDMMQYKESINKQIQDELDRKAFLTNPLDHCQNLMGKNYENFHSLVGQLIYIALIHLRVPRLRNAIEAGDWRWWTYGRRML